MCSIIICVGYPANASASWSYLVFKGLLLLVISAIANERISDCSCDRLAENCSQRRWGGCGGHHWFGKHFWNHWYLRQDSPMVCFVFLRCGRNSSKQGKHQTTDVGYSSKGWSPWIKGWMGALKYWVASKHCQETWALAWLFKAAWVLARLISACLHSHLPTYRPASMHARIHTYSNGFRACLGVRQLLAERKVIGWEPRWLAMSRSAEWDSSRMDIEELNIKNFTSFLAHHFLLVYDVARYRASKMK